MLEDKEWLGIVMSETMKNITSRAANVRYQVSRVNYRLMSSMSFMRVTYTNTLSGLSEERLLVIKRYIGGGLVPQVETHFHNEILFYRTYCKPGENFPICYGSKRMPKSIDDSFIVLNDVTEQGFETSPCALDVPYNYVLATVHELGRFHAKGYVMKERKPAEFFDIVNKIQETRFGETIDSRYRMLLDGTASRAVKYLRAHGHDVNFCDKMEAVLSNVFEEAIKGVIEPSKPLSTICHGDVTLSNVLYKDQGNGHLKAMLVDFALLRYGTPVIDLSTFIYLSCTDDTMRNNLPDILRTYHQALMDSIIQGGVEDVGKYSYQAILDDYKRGCIFGFAIASFYLATLYGHMRAEDLPRDIATEDLIKICCESGGESMSKILADLLLQMHEFGCLDHML